MIPIALGQYFELRNANHTHNYNLRPRSNRVETINTRTQIGEKSLQYRGPIVWNVIPENIRDCTTFVTFKKQLKLHLLLLQSIE